MAKFREALTGPYNDVIVPTYAAARCDWEGELAVVIGKTAYQVDEADAEAYIAGYSVINDYTMRDYRTRTLQWDAARAAMAVLAQPLKEPTGGGRCKK